MDGNNQDDFDYQYQVQEDEPWEYHPLREYVWDTRCIEVSFDICIVRLKDAIDGV